VERRIARAWQLAYQRPADPEELNAARRFVEHQRSGFRNSAGKGDPDFAALTNLCQQLLSSNEFLYVD
jgi:hypothetical protein